jgi:hypothetical protein
MGVAGVRLSPHGIPGNVSLFVQTADEVKVLGQLME